MVPILSLPQHEGDEHRRTEVLSISYPTEYAEFGINTALLKMLAGSTAGIHEPIPTQIARPAGTPIEAQVPLAPALLVAAAILFVLEMILRRFSIANRHLTAFLERLRGKPTIEPMETQAIRTSVGTTSFDGRIQEDTTSSQPAETTMTRLLAAKKRAR